MRRVLLAFAAFLSFYFLKAQTPQLWGLAGGDLGVIFNYTTASSTYANQYYFQGPPGDGEGAVGRLIHARNGLLYGMAGGGTYNHGIIYSINPSSSAYNNLYSFTGDTGSGAQPWGGLVQASNGLLYGTTAEGGTYNKGVIFSYNTSTDTYINLYNFADDSNSGAGPDGSLIQASDGLLYGVTTGGGANSIGVIFTFNPVTNTYTNLFNFAGNNNGASPTGSLVQATNGLLYGMTYYGSSGDIGLGVIFSYNPATSQYTSLYNFIGGDSSGASPYTSNSLMQASNGLLYGMTYEGGYWNEGVIFSYNPLTSTYTHIHAFEGYPVDGSSPDGSLIQASNGLLYGVAEYGGINPPNPPGPGTIFSLNPTGNIYTNVYTFNGTTSGTPTGDLLELVPCSILNTGISAAICQGSSYNFNGTGLTAEGVYVDTLTTAGGCDSVVTLNLTVNPAPVVNPVANITTCTGDTVAAVQFTATTGASISWSGTNHTIGAASSGGSSVPSFVAVNNGTAPVIDTITVTSLLAPGGYAYITQDGTDSVMVISTATNTIVGQIKVGSTPLGLAVSTDGSRVYVGNAGSHTVSVINTATNTVIATIPVQSLTEGVAASPDGSRVYVANFLTHSIDVINTATNTVIDTILAVGAPSGLAVSPDGSKLYVEDAGSDNVMRIFSTATNALIDTIHTGTQLSNGIVFSPDGSKAYFTRADSTVGIINTATNTITGTVYSAQLNGAMGLDISPDGSTLYVAAASKDQVTLINTATNTVTGTIATGSYPVGVSFSADGSYVYVVNQLGNSVSVINTATRTVIATLPVRNSPNSFGKFVSGASACSGTPVTFTITVNPTLRDSLSATINLGSSYSFNGQLLTAPGYYRDTLTASTTCDSIVVLHLSVDTCAPVFTNLNQSICQGSSYNFNGTTLTASGTYTDTLTIGSGCDSIIRLNLAVNPLPVANPVSNQTVCSGSPTNTINFTGTNAGAFNWTGTNNTIGLATSGTGDISSFTAINPGVSSVTDTVTVTPSSPQYAYMSPADGDSMQVLNTATGATVASIKVGRYPTGMSLTPDGSKMFVACQLSNSVWEINTATNTVIDSIPVGSGPVDVTLNHSGTKAYSANVFAGTVTVINVSTRTVDTTIAVNSGPSWITVSPNDSIIYVSCNSTDSIEAINTHTYRKAGAFVVAQPFGSATTGDGSKIYMVNQGGTIYIGNTSAYTITDSIVVGNRILMPILNSDDSRLYVTENFGDAVAVINTATGTIIDTVRVGNGPRGLAFGSGGNLLYVDAEPGSSLTVINTATLSVVNTFPTIPSPVSKGTFIVPGTGCTGAPVTFSITVNPTLRDSISATTTEGTPYNFNGQQLNTPGIYRDTLQSSAGCDSIVTLNLTVHDTAAGCPPVFTNLNQSICAGSTYNFDGAPLTTAGNYTDTLTTTGGCDSIVTLTLKVNPLPVVTLSWQALVADTLMFTTPPVDTLILSCQPYQAFALTGGLPSGGTYSGIGIFNDSLFVDSVFIGLGGHTAYDTISYIYTDTNNCTASVTDILTAGNCITCGPVYVIINQNICNDDSVLFNGTYLHTAGTYTDTLTTTAGCDSIVTLILAVNSAYNTGITITLCGDSNYTYNGHTVTAPGIYTDTLTGIYGCDSIVTLVLLVSPLPVISFNINPDTLCNRAAAITLSATPAGGTFSGPGVTGNMFNPALANAGRDSISYHYTDSTGCSATAQSQIFVVNFPDSIAIADTVIEDSLYAPTPHVGNANLFTTTSVPVAKYLWQIQQVGALSISNVGVNSDSFTVDCWILAEMPFIDTALYGEEFEVRAIVTVDGCTDTSSWLITTRCDIVGWGINPVDLSNAISIYPNPTSQLLYIKTQNITPQTIDIYDVEGRLVSTQRFTPQLEVSRLSPGLYLMQITATEGTARLRWVKM